MHSTLKCIISWRMQYFSGVLQDGQSVITSVFLLFLLFLFLSSFFLERLHFLFDPPSIFLIFLYGSTFQRPLIFLLIFVCLPFHIKVLKIRNNVEANTSFRSFWYLFQQFWYSVKSESFCRVQLDDQLPSRNR